MLQKVKHSLPSLFSPSSKSKRPLCSVCQTVIKKRYKLGGRAGGLSGFGVLVPHHRTWASFQASINQECHVCTGLWQNTSKAQRDSISTASFRKSVTSMFFMFNNSIPLEWRDSYGPNTMVMKANLHDTDGETECTSPFCPALIASYNLHSPAADTTRSEESWQLAMKWYDECTSSHSKCKAVQSCERWFPSRLIDIGLSTNCDPWLLITKDTPPDGPYLTLSHHWGSAQFLQLTSSSLDRLTQNISMSELPKTFADAIYITRRLGFHYLWIDSLCIIQDSTNDWLHEALLMRLVYANSMCNIAATRATDSSDGLFRQRTLHNLYPCEIATSCDGIQDPVNYHIIDISFWETQISHTLLNQRAWAVQERLLAPRVLHFGAQQLLWECCKSNAVEKYPTGLPLALKETANFKSFEPAISRESMTKFSGKEWDESYSFNMFWNKIIKTYSSSRLTNVGDKTIALSGIAKMLQSVMNDKYVAGLWKEYFTSQLFWEVQDCRQSNGEPSVRPSLYLAPSWSWLSVDGVISGPGWSRKGFLIDILDISIVPETSDTTGPISKGHIHVLGVLKELRLERMSGGSKQWKMYLNGIEIFELLAPHQARIGPQVSLDVDQGEFTGPLYCMCVEDQEQNLEFLMGPLTGFGKRFVRGLILEPAGTEVGRFQRLGMFWVRLPKLIESFLAPNENGETMPCEHYDAATGKHSIYID